MFIIKEGTPADKIGEGTDQATLDAVEKYLQKSGKTIRTADQDKTYVKANAQPHIDEAFGTRNKQLEDDVYATTGIPKLNSEEKYYDYFKRAMKDAKAKADKVVELEGKIATLEASGGSAKALKEYKDQLETLQNTIKTNAAEFETKLSAAKAEVVGTKIKIAADQALTEITPKLKKIDDLIKADVFAARMAKFSSEVAATEVEGHIIYKGKDGQTITSKTDGKPKNAREILEESYFADLIDTGRTNDGGIGSGKKKEGGDDKAAWKDIQLDKTKVVNKVQLMEFLEKDKKMKPDSKEFNEAFEELGKDLPLR